VANYKCDDCGIMLDAVDEGQTEECPRCGKEMVINTGSILKNFGGAGVAGMGRETPKP
jgi:DNA-directed RNA polymerase subunit RPC12/RpoP